MKDKSVRGHLCEGLKKYQEYSTYSCIPNFKSSGATRGCDDTNNIPIVYCPFCGEKLPSVVIYKYKCNDCDNLWESLEKEDDPYCEGCFRDNVNVEEQEQ